VVIVRRRACRSPSAARARSGPSAPLPLINGVTYDGSQCTNIPTASYNVIHRKLQPDDIAGVLVFC
jgi:hypothetical protein